MPREKISKIIALASALTGILVMLVPRYIFPVCQFYGRFIETKAGKLIPMRCFYTAQAELAVGAVIFFSALALIFARQAETRKTVSMILVLLGLVVIFLPALLIGVCKDPSMPCHAGTLPALTILGGALVILSLLGAYLARERR
ncbi:MAG: DUF4418 family protein [Bacillota bacterium]